MNAKTTLWSDSTRTRHFLIPDDAALPTGEFVLRTLAGRQQDVDGAAVSAYEVSQDEAKEWLKGQVGDVIEQAKGALLDALRPLQEPRYRPPRRRPAGTGARPAEPKAGPSPVLSLFAALTNQPVQSLKSDPEAVTRGLRHVVDELGAIVSDAVAPDPARHEAARRRTEALRAAFRRHGVPVSDRVDTLPDRLRQLQRAAETPERRAASADALESLARDIEEAAGNAAAHLRRLAAELRDPAESSTAEGPEDGRPGGTTSPGPAGRPEGKGEPEL